MSDDLSRYRENCSLFTTLPVASFENALAHRQPVCSLAGQGVDDNAMVRRRCFATAATPASPAVV